MLLIENTSLGTSRPSLMRAMCACVLALILMPLLVDAKVLPLNGKKVPKTTVDLLEIQGALLEHLENSRKATVSISLGQGFGSGVIVSPDGLILTAAHVTAAVDKELTVIMNDGRKLKAVSMGLVSNTDAAMMRITEEGEYPYVEINKSNDYKMGHWVYALGHSGGFDKARGPVVRLGRIVKDVETTLHTDCKVIGGDSGGPLFDLSGRLIGIHSRVQASMEQNMHVPMREYLRHWKAMQENKFLGDGPFAQRPVKGTGFLGVGSTEVEGGLRIDKVGKDSAAEKAGLKVGDVMTRLGEKKLSTKADLKEVLKEMAAGQKVSMTVLRNGKEQTFEFPLGKR